MKSVGFDEGGRAWIRIRSRSIGISINMSRIGIAWRKVGRRYGVMKGWLGGDIGMIDIDMVGIDDGGRWKVWLLLL